MDNLVNSLVSKTIGLTDQQVKDKLLASPNMNDAQMVQFMRTNGVSPSQMSAANGMPEGQIAARVAATIPQGSSVTLGDTVIVPQYRTTGSGMDEQIGPLEGFATSKSNGDVNYKAPVGTPVQMYSADGQFVSTVKTKKDQSFFGGLVDAFKDPVVLAALGGAYAGGLFGGTGALGTGAGSAFELANAGAGAFEGGTALNTLAGTGAGSAFEAANAGATAMTDLGASELANAGATALSDLGASELANAGASANTVGGTTLSNVANAGNAATAATAANAATTANAANAANTLINPVTGLIASAAGNVLGNVANQQGINDARNAITQGSATANTQLNNAYTNAQNLNLANTTALGNNYQNLNTNLNNTLNAQRGVYDATGTTLANNYQNLNTNLNNTLNAQAGAYNTANQNINANAANQMGLLANTYTGQQNQAASNQANLQNSYANTLGNMGTVYNQQVGYQSPYQSVGQAGSQSILQNLPYLNSQFGAADLNAQLAPNYAFQLQQGQMANQRAGNISGGALGGNVLRGLQDYTQNYAGGAYQKAFENYQTQRNNIYNTLASMAGIGTTSAGQLAGLGNTLGTNMGSLSSSLGGNLTSNTGNLLNAGTAYGSNTSGVSNNLNNVLSTNLGQMQNAYNNYGNNLTTGSTNYAGNVLGNANQMQGAYNQYGSNLTGASNAYGGNLTTNTGQGINAANAYGLNTANLATGTAAALASNATATGANNATALNNLGNTALLASMIKAT